MRIEIFTKSETLPDLSDGCILHSRMIFTILENSKGCKPYMLVAYDDNGVETGHLLIAKRMNFKLLPPVLSYWYTIFGEGVYHEGYEEREKVFALFIEKVFDMFDFRHTYIEVQNINDSRFAYGVLRSHNFIPIRDLRLYISLHSKDPRERITRAYKAHIKKASNNGVTFHRATESKDIDDGLALLKNYYISKVRRRLPDTKTLKMMLYNADGSLREDARLFIVCYKGKTIGSSVCLYDKERAYLAYSCGLRKSYPLQYPGIMAIWAALSDAYTRKYGHFEFLEARVLPYFHRKFLNTLLNYGGKQVGTLRWYHFRWNWLNKILRSIYV